MCFLLTCTKLKGLFVCLWLFFALRNREMKSVTIEGNGIVMLPPNFEGAWHQMSNFRISIHLKSSVSSRAKIAKKQYLSMKDVEPPYQSITLYYTAEMSAELGKWIRASAT